MARCMTACDHLAARTASSSETAWRPLVTMRRARLRVEEAERAGRDGDLARSRPRSPSCRRRNARRTPSAASRRWWSSPSTQPPSSTSSAASSRSSSRHDRGRLDLEVDDDLGAQQTPASARDPSAARSSGVPGASAASSRCSGPHADDRRYARRAPQAVGSSATSTSSTARRCCPTATSKRPLVAIQLALEEVHRRAADEAGDEDVGGLVVQLLRRRDLLQLALAHHRDALPERHRLDLVVGDVDRRDRRAPCAGARSPRASASRSFASRFESGSSIRNARGSRMIARPIATRWRCPPESWRGLRLSCSSSSSSRAIWLTLLIDLVATELPQPEREGEILVDRLVRVERIVLEDHRDVALARRQRVDDLGRRSGSRPR